MSASAISKKADRLAADNLVTTYSVGSPLYMQIKTRIREVVGQKSLVPGSKLPSVRELGSLIGVSQATAARAVSQMIREGYFISRPRSGVFLAEASPEKIISPLTTIYCLAGSRRTPNDAEQRISHSPFWSSILNGVRQELSQLETPIRLRFAYAPDFLEEKEITPRGRDWEGVGLLLLGDPRESYAAKLKELGPALVCIHGPNRPSQVSAVHVDTGLAMEKLVDHLVLLGHRHIALCGELEAGPNIDREKTEAYLSAMKRHGLKVDPDTDCRLCLASMEEGYRAVQPLLVQPDRPTAIMFINDEAAIGALRAIHEAGLRVPQDISITGFDNIPTSRFVTPTLTTISMPMVEMGRVGVRQLLQAHRTGHAESVVLKSELVVRESTGSIHPLTGRKKDA